MKNSTRSTSAINPITTEITTENVSLLSILLKREVAILHCFQLQMYVCFTHYTMLQMNNSMRSTSAINPAIMKIMDDFL